MNYREQCTFGGLKGQSFNAGGLKHRFDCIYLGEGVIKLFVEHSTTCDSNSRTYLNCTVLEHVLTRFESEKSTSDVVAHTIGSQAYIHPSVSVCSFVDIQPVEMRAILLGQDRARLENHKLFAFHGDSIILVPDVAGGINTLQPLWRKRKNSFECVEKVKLIIT